MLLPLLVLLACTEQAQEPCATPSCRLEAVRALWDAPPAEVAQAIDALPAVTERLIALEAYVLEHGERVDQRDFCGALAEGAPRLRCLELTGRPHLWDERRQDPIEAAVEPSWQDASALEGCSEGSAVLCAQAQAKGLAAGDDATPDAPCAALAEPRWADECRLQVASELVLQHREEGIERAVEVCGRATVLRRMCKGHLCSRLAELAPPAAEHDPEGWARVESVAERLRVAIGTEGAYWAEHYWSMATWMAVRRGDRVHPEVVARLPASAQPQLRSALAWRIVEVASPEGARLEALVVQLEAAMGGAPVVAAPDAPPRSRLGLRRMQDHWEAPAEEHASVHFQGLSRRLLAAEPAADCAVCILEAAAQLPPPRIGLLEQGLEHPDPTVQATARRLLGKLGRQPRAH